MPIFVVTLTTTVIIACCLALHHEVLRILYQQMIKWRRFPRLRIAIVFPVLLLTHIIEIWLFAFGFLLLNGWDGCGRISGPIESFLDVVYFSAVCYSTIGFGDLVPVGPLRFLAAIEGISGLLMITWSSTFIFGLMHDIWRQSAPANVKPPPM